MVLRSLTPALHRLDHALGKLRYRRDVLIELRTPVSHAVLHPIAEGLGGHPDVKIWYTSEFPAHVAALVPAGSLLTHAQVEWRRFDLYVNGDPWAAARVRRCAHRVNFFHGVAGKYDLDNPSGLPMGFDSYTHVAFINRDRMQRYLEAGVVTSAQAVLVGYPKLDRLANGEYDSAAVRAGLGFLERRPTALYAPTYSPASSLHLAGEAIVETLTNAGFNVILKLHDRSLDPDPRYNEGVDWRARCAALQRAHPGRVSFTEIADATPLLAAADLMVTDHSSIGFEYLLVDRPLIVFDAPDLPRAARINPDKVSLLRSTAAVVRTPEELAAAAVDAVRDPARMSPMRQRVARELFHDPGRATERSVTLLRSLLRPSSRAGALERAAGSEARP
jgi:hypothetical protein